MALPLLAMAVRRLGWRAFQPDRLAAMLARRLAALGLVSCSFYLWHEILLRWLSAWIKAHWGTATLPAPGINFALGLALSGAPVLRARSRLRSPP